MNKLELILSASLVVFANGTCAFAQNLFRQSEPQILSPSAYETCKYGRVPVNYFNGLPEITVPLAEVNAKGYTLPVYLTYHASGNKPDQHPGWVGLGWSLHAGGSITRIIKGQKDELSSVENAHNTGHAFSYDPGYLYRAHRIQANITWSNLDTLYYQCFDPDFAESDSEPDEFIVSLEGIQASFYITGEGAVKIVSRSDASFDVDWTLGTDTDNTALTVYEHPTNASLNKNARRYTYLKSFTLRDREGNVYYFGGADDAIEYSVSQKPDIYLSGGSYHGGSGWDATATANTWMLTRIERPDGEEITFTYKHEDSVPIIVHDFHYGYDYSYRISQLSPLIQSTYDTYSENPSSKNNLSVTFLLPSYLESISCRLSGDQLNFGSSASTELGYSISPEDFALRVGNYTGTVFPLSYNDFMEKSYFLKLDSIAGSGRNIALTYTSDPETRLKLTNVRFLSAAGGSMDHQYQFTYNQTPLPGYNSRMTDRWGYYNGHDYSASIADYGHTMYAARYPDASYMQAEILTEIVYPTGGRTSFEYEPHTYFRVATQFPFGVENCEQDNVAGGLRIKSITDRTGTKTADKRTFTYTGQYAGATHSSGVLSGRQEFYIHGTMPLYAGNPYSMTYNLSYTSFSELPFNPLSETDGNHVTYSYVTETHPDGGSTVYHYSNHENSYAIDANPTTSLAPQDAYLESTLQFNSAALFRGLILDREDKKSGGTTVRKETYTYNTSHTEHLKAVSKKVLIEQIGLASQSDICCAYPYLSGKTVIEYTDSNNPLTDTYSFQYNADRRPTSQTHTVNGKTDGAVTFYPGDRSGSVYTAMQQAGMSGIPVGQATLRQGNVIAAKEVTYKETAVSTASGTAYTFVPEAVYTAEFTAPVSLSSYRSVPMSYCSDPDISCLRYDEHANLTGTETRDGIRTTYAWDVTARQPVFIARGVNPGQSTVGNVTRQKSHSLMYGQSNAFSGSYVSVQSGTVTFTLQPAYGFDWLANVQIDGQSGYVVQVNIPETPPSQWLQYLQQYNNASIQFTVPAGTHTYQIIIADSRKGTGASSNNGGTIQVSYSAKGTLTTPGDPILFEDFETETGGTAGYHSPHGHSGTYTVNKTIPTDRSYVIDYMLYENGAWGYHRESYTGGSKTLGALGKRLDNIRIFPADCDFASATYNASGLLASRTDARGVTESYEYDGLRRLVRNRDNDENPVEEYIYNYAHGTGNNVHNGVTTKTFTAANSSTSYRTAISYLDSLGRPTQQVLVNGAASGWDLVTYQDYDVNGREYRKWLPAPVQVVSGGHTAGAYAELDEIRTGGNEVYSSSDSYRYEQPVYEASPRDRVKEYYGPGSAWRGSTKHRFVNTLARNVGTTTSMYYYRGFSLLWTGNTSLTLTRASTPTTGSLHITRVADEDSQKTLEFRNSFGETVLVRKVFNDSTFYDTHYVYDDLGRLAAVIPPKLSLRLASGTSWNYSNISDLAYLYRYDSRGNCIARSLPGAGWTYTVYDKGNRPVLTQDAAQRAQSSTAWTFALPDHLGRPAVRGTATLSVSAFSDPYKTAVVQAALPKAPTYTGTYRGYVLSGITLSSPVLLEVDYYDNYGFAGASPFPAANNADFAYDSSIGTNYTAYYSPSAQGLQTGSLLKVLDNTGGNQYLWSVTYYDDRAQVVQHRASTHLGGVEKDWYKLDFLGRRVSHKITHKPSTGSALSEVITQTYDTWDRPLVTKHKRGSSTAVTIASRTYDKAGRLKTLMRNGKTALKSTYSYNIRSWLYDISGTLFSETLSFVSGSPARFGGDVSKVTWKDDRNTGSTRDSYSFTYNGVGRLLQANYTDHDSASGANFTEKVAYDRNGNITTLQRYGRTGASTYGRIDYLALTYSGNRLSTVKDTGSAAYSNDFRYSNTTSTTYSYTYDAAGRMKKDAAKGISSISWNVLGLPQTVTFSNGNVINYSYAADGTKLREARTASGTTNTTDYTGTLVLEDGTRSRMLFDGGYVSMSDIAYHFFLTDHVGSVRVVANSNGVAEEYNHYYPLGGLLPTSTSSTGIQPLKYQGKEWAGAKGLNLYDFGARRYDPATGRWFSQDPLAEKYYGHSPYLFCAANPMRYVDPTGEEILPRQLAEYLGISPEYQYSQLLDDDYGPYSVLAYYDSNDTIVGYGATKLVKNGQNYVNRFDYIMTDPSDLSLFAERVGLFSIEADILNFNGGPSTGELSILSGSIWQGLKTEWVEALHNPVYWLYVATSFGYSSLALPSSLTIEQVIKESTFWGRGKNGWRIKIKNGVLLDDFNELSRTYNGSVGNSNGYTSFSTPDFVAGYHRSTSTGLPTLDINSKTAGKYKIRYK